jgi:uncharacterized damage-inducible protein DinB
MITDIAAYLRFFGSVMRRTERDVEALPPAAVAWRPPPLAGEAEWSIGEIVRHLGGARLYFASAYRNEGWLWTHADCDPDDQRTWLPWLRASGQRFVERLEHTPPEWLNRRIEMIDTPGASLSGWRLLMMNMEHEVHHRSQIDAYAGLQGWPVPDIFNRAAESIDALQAQQREKYGGRAGR